jgi:hypothetical protein
MPCTATQNSKVGDVINAQMARDYIREFTERRNRIIEREGRRNFMGDEYARLIDEDKDIESKRVKETLKDVDSNPERPTTDKDSVVEAVIDEDPFTSTAPAGVPNPHDNGNVCVSCEG